VYPPPARPPFLSTASNISPSVRSYCISFSGSGLIRYAFSGPHCDISSTPSIDLSIGFISHSWIALRSVREYLLFSVISAYIRTFPSPEVLGPIIGTIPGGS